MNKLSYYAFIALIIFVFSAFQINKFESELFYKSSPQSLDQITDVWNKDVNGLISTLEKIKEDNSINLSDYKQARYHLKRLEPLWEFVEHEKYNAKINAAPLLKPEPGSIDFTILEPQGFQVIDELMSIDNVKPEQLKKELNGLIVKLLKETKNSVHYINQYPIHDYVFFEAFKLSINRFYNLGISDFDTPGTDFQFIDGLVLINYWQEIYSKYYQSILEKHQPKQSKIIVQCLNRIENKLKQAESLEFADLLRNDVLPLNKAIVTAQNNIGVEFLDEVSPLPMPVNPRANHFMANDYLNTNYFVGIHKNENTESIVKLGEILFNDPILSGNNKRACASCHKPELAFADGNPKAINFDQNGLIARNSPGLINAVFAKDFFHDLRAESLQGQVDHVVNNPDEFATSFKDMAIKLNKSDEYKALFNENFSHHKNPISKHTITQSIAVYISTLQSFNSPFDLYVRKESDIFDKEAKAGYNLFMGKAACATCHFAPTFAGLLPPFYNDTESEILGVWEKFDTITPTLDQDFGRGDNGKIRSEVYIYDRSFKTVTLRNIKETGPYMHHGNFKNLQEVLHFYNKGGGDGVGLTVPFQTLSADPLGLSQIELNQLEAFMNQLSDNPFKQDQPLDLPTFKEDILLNNRVWGGEY